MGAKCIPAFIISSHFYSLIPILSHVYCRSASVYLLTSLHKCYLSGVASYRDMVLNMADSQFVKTTGSRNIYSLDNANILA